jgi:hypothetical protein
MCTQAAWPVVFALGVCLATRVAAAMAGAVDASVDAGARIGQIRACGQGAPPAVVPRQRRTEPRPDLVEPPEIAVEPLRFGPRIADDPRDDGPMTAAQFRALIPDDELRACYRWARGRAPALEAELAVVLRTDAWGAVESADVRASRGSASGRWRLSRRSPPTRAPRRPFPRPPLASRGRAST